MIVKTNGFELQLTDMMNYTGGVDVLIDIGDERISKAIRDRDVLLLDALAHLLENKDEIREVMVAENSFEMWIGCHHLDGECQCNDPGVKQEKRHSLLKSRFSSQRLRQRVLEEIKAR